MNSEVRSQDVRCVCIQFYLFHFETLCGMKTFRSTISIFIHKYISIFTICAHIPYVYIFFRKKVIRFTKKPFLFVKHYNITYVHTTIQNNGSLVGNGLNRYTARAYIPDQQMSYYSCFSLSSPVHLSRSLIKKYTYIFKYIILCLQIILNNFCFLRPLARQAVSIVIFFFDT